MQNLKEQRIQIEFEKFEKYSKIVANILFDIVALKVITN